MFHKISSVIDQFNIWRSGECVSKIFKPEHFIELMYDLNRDIIYDEDIKILIDKNSLNGPLFKHISTDNELLKNVVWLRDASVFRVNYDGNKPKTLRRVQKLFRHNHYCCSHNTLISESILVNNLQNSYENVNKLLKAGAKLKNGIKYLVEKCNSHLLMSPCNKFDIRYPMDSDKNSIDMFVRYLKMLLENGADINETNIYDVMDCLNYKLVKIMMIHGLNIFESESVKIMDHLIKRANKFYRYSTNIGPEIDDSEIIDISSEYVKICNLLTNNGIHFQHTLEIKNTQLKTYCNKFYIPILEMCTSLPKVLVDLIVYYT